MSNECKRNFTRALHIRISSENKVVQFESERMAMLNFGGSEVSGGKCQGLAGMKCDEYHTHIAPISNDHYESIKNNEARDMHISFNGYYGYLPHVQSAGSDFAMDTTDTLGSASLSDQNSNAYGYNSSNMQSVNGRVMHVPFVRRKRNCGESNQADTSKRLKKEETVGLDSAQGRVLPTTNNNDFHYPRCLMEHKAIYGKDTERSQRFVTEEHDLELENLLKQTHGCDLYHFYSCDI